MLPILSRHPRESGGPVSQSGAVDHEPTAILGHPVKSLVVAAECVASRCSNTASLSDTILTVARDGQQSIDIEMGFEMIGQRIQRGFNARVIGQR
jgi:hypothetical protein